MIQHDGYWYPDDDVTFHRFTGREGGYQIPWVLENVEGRGTIIQAGANCGLFPITLAQHFQSVVTFEPDPDNWACLRQNLTARDCLKRVHAWCAALGEREGFGLMKPHENEPENRGAGFVETTQDGFRVVPLDRLRISACDALWLDIEGMELAALKGAEQTIREFSPVIITEENGNGARYGVGECDIEDYLTTLGYERVGGMLNDRLYRRTHV